MAETLRRAARHYEMRELREGTLPVDLGVLARCDSYQDAVEAAFVYLEQHEPEALEIVRVEDGERTSVWTYSASRRAEQPDLVRLWGFDVTRSWGAAPP